MKFNKDYVDHIEPENDPLTNDRPDRDTTISKDEITNLKILLNTELDFETILSSL